MADNNEQQTVKVSELPLSSSFTGLYTLGTDSNGKSVKVSLEGVGNAAAAAQTAAQTATTAAANVKDGDDGKTPVIAIGQVTDAGTASATLESDGVDAEGNPKYKLNLSIPKGKQGEPGADGDNGTDGKTPVMTIGTVTTVADSEQASAMLVPDGVDTEGNPKYKLNLSIPKGEKGTDGTGSGNVSASGTGLEKNKEYLFVPSANNSTEGVFVEYTAPAVPTKVSQLTNDADYALSADVETSLSGKVDKVSGKGLSSNDYTTSDKQQVAKIASLQTSLSGKVEAVDGAIKLEQGTNGADFVGTYNGYRQGGVRIVLGTSSSGTGVATVWLYSNAQGIAVYNTGEVRLKATAPDASALDKPNYTLDVNNGTIGNVNSLTFGDDIELIGGCPLKVVNASTGTVTLKRGTLYVISGQTTINISVPPEIEGFAAEYNAVIVTGTTAPTVSFPASLKWGGGEAPTFEASKTYQIVIFRGVGYCSQDA